MSTIIDALKRSDRERQINTTHTMSYSHLNAEDNKSNAWLKNVLILLLFIIALSAALTYWFNRDVAETSSPQVSAISTSSLAIQTVENNSPEITIAKVETPIVVSPIKAPPKEPIQKVNNSALASIVKPVAESETQATLEASRTSLSDLVIIPSTKAKSPESSPATELTVEVSQTSTPPSQEEKNFQQSDFIGYDNYASIRSSQNLPKLHLDILMYHPIPTQRKAFINMQAYRQGEQISEGAELLKIGEKGVLLRYQGKDFVLSTN